ncbi:MAG: hypothetical protein C4583_19025 [Anaerolineaceae bacterium]|nr:MAG: hypothetical protein C4583_19025 [Anaerolineaceae bacterium]
MRRILLALLFASLLTSCLPASSPGLSTRMSPPTDAPTTTPSAPTMTPPGNIILPQLAWFYKPPFEDEELFFLAREFGFFILTRGDEEERDQLLALGASRPILQYLRFDAIHAEENCQARPRRNQVAYREGDYCTISAEHPDWFLLNRQGERIYQDFEDQVYVMMDAGSPGWRTFFLERVRDSQSDANWGGVFLDNVEVTFSFRESANEFPLAYADEAAYLAASQGMLEMLQREYFQPSGKLLFANIAARKGDYEWMAYLAHIDGAMHEGWAVDWPDRFRSADRWERQMTLAEETQAAGKFIILVSQGTQGDVELQQFAYASYLLVNHGRAAFRYANSNNYREVWYYSKYDFELGRPLGPRYPDGDAWRREYEFGSVMVNPHTHEASITLK